MSFHRQRPLLVGVGEVLGAENRLHRLVGGEPLPSLVVLQVLLRDVSPKLLDHLQPGDLLSLLCANDLGQSVRDVSEAIEVQIQMTWQM